MNAGQVPLIDELERIVRGGPEAGPAGCSQQKKPGAVWSGPVFGTNLEARSRNCSPVTLAPQVAGILSRSFTSS